MAKSAVQAAVEDLAGQFGQNAYLIYAMGLEIGTNDYDTLFRDHVIDSPADRKVDFFYLNTETRRAIVAQSYFVGDWTKAAAKSNKAADLNTARSWLLDRDHHEIAEPAVRKAAEELRDALSEGTVDSVDFFYVHNLPESGNVGEEIKTLEAALQTRLNSDTDWGPREIVGRATEYGINRVVSLQEQTTSTIRVSEEIELTSSTEPQELSAPNWRAMIATVSADQLSALVAKFGIDLYSSNVREYLGSRNTWRNINNQIERTAREAPDNFWVFNNGITLLSQEVQKKGKRLKCRGLSVVNGAQTVGSLGTLKDVDLTSVLLQARIVEVHDPGIATNIIRFNNTQNPIKAWELRAIDPVQNRISDDFQNVYSLTYQIRRGTSRRTVQDVHFEKLAPWASAFYGDPYTPYRNRRELYESDGRYADIFNHESSVRNLLFVYRVGEAVSDLKDRLREKVLDESATDNDRSLYGYFSYGAFQYVLVYLVSRVIETAVPGVGANVPRRVTMTDAVTLADRQAAIDALAGLVRFTAAPIPFSVGEDAYGVFRSADEVRKLARTIEASVQQQEALAPGTVAKLTSGVRVF